jgi:hypothetical protein
MKIISKFFLYIDSDKIKLWQGVWNHYPLLSWTLQLLLQQTQPGQRKAAKLILAMTWSNEAIQCVTSYIS